MPQHPAALALSRWQEVHMELWSEGLGEILTCIIGLDDAVGGTDVLHRGWLGGFFPSHPSALLQQHQLLLREALCISGLLGSFLLKLL